MDRGVALPSHLPTLSYLRHTISLKKAMCWIPSTMMMMTSNAFDYREDHNTETPEELLAMIRFEGTVGFQAKLRKLCEEYIDVFSAKVEPMSIVVDRGKWEVSRNRLR
jgi:hypothetical protein